MTKESSDQDLETVIVCEATKSFLAADTEKLAHVGITPRNFRDAFVARNNFYEVCADTPELQGIGFTTEPNFPVQRKDFLQLQVNIPPKEEGKVEAPWWFGIIDLKVTSPNWDRGDLSRHWKGRDKYGRERFFQIEDENFWLLAGNGKVHAHVVDVIKVQWAYQGKTSHPINCKVLRVLEFNGEKISDPIDEDFLKQSYSMTNASNDRQGDLF